MYTNILICLNPDRSIQLGKSIQSIKLSVLRLLLTESGFLEILWYYPDKQGQGGLPHYSNLNIKNF